MMFVVTLLSCIAILAIGLLAICVVVWQQPLAGGLTLFAYGLVYSRIAARDRRHRPRLG